MLFVFEWIVARHVEKMFWIVPGFCLLVWGMVVFLPLPLSYSHVFLLTRVFFQSGSECALAGMFFVSAGFTFQMELLHGNSSGSVFAASIIFYLLKSF